MIHPELCPLTFRRTVTSMRFYLIVSYLLLVALAGVGVQSIVTTAFQAWGQTLQAAATIGLVGFSFLIAAVFVWGGLHDDVLGGPKSSGHSF